MPADNKLELVVEVDVNKANASIKSINTGLSCMEQAAGKAARGASAGIDGLTVSMVKGSAAGTLLTDSIKKALDWAREWTIGATEHAAHTDKMSMSMMTLAKARMVSARRPRTVRSKRSRRSAAARRCPAHGRGHEPVESGGTGEGRQGRSRH
jgi:phosphopantetheine adenylyltransferase